MLAEALDRLRRDQAEITTLYKHLTFAGVRIITIAEGEITEMLIQHSTQIWSAAPPPAMSLFRAASSARAT